MADRPGRAPFYDRTFFDYIERGAQRSAVAVVPLVTRSLSPRTVLDVGCGRGVWVRQWLASGVDATGVDGSYVEGDLVIPRDRFHAVDLTKPFALDRRFDLVQCLEVAEHLPATSAAGLVASLAAHGDLVFFSAAVPGQGGAHHVNEQPREYWRDLFAARGYRAFDFIRPLLRGNGNVEPWYRYNSLLFASDAAVSMLPPQVRGTELAGVEPIPEIAPMAWRARNLALQFLPRRAVERLARLKHGALSIAFRRSP